MRRTEQRKAGDEKPHQLAVPTAGSLADIAEIQTRLAELPVVDDRSPDEIIGYDEFGLAS
jgi:antitoxin VapB